MLLSPYFRGKFENGAETGAFGYLFNCSLHPGTCTTADASAIRAGIRNCPSFDENSCTRMYIGDAQEAGMVGNPARDILTAQAVTVVAPYVTIEYGVPALIWTGRVTYAGGLLAEIINGPVSETFEALNAGKPPIAQLKDIPEVASQIEKWLENLPKVFKAPPTK